MSKKTASAVSPSLPQKNNLIEKGEREVQLLGSREIYEYANVPGLPMPMAAPRAAILQLSELVGWIEGQGINLAKILADLEIWKLEAGGSPSFSTFADYAKVFTIFEAPDIVGTWQDDRIFASQRMAGLNPMTLNLVTANGSAGMGWAQLSPKLSATINDQAIQPLLGPTATIQQAIQQNRLFVTDYAPLQAAVASETAPGWQKGKPLMAPIALFVKTDNFPGLLPLAIQLGQSPNSPVYLASESGQPGKQYQWLMAKTFLQSADLNLNQVLNHLCLTHLIEEAFAIAMQRRLAWQHPLYCLLQNHFAALLVINQAGVLTLINSTGIVQQILEGGVSGSLQLIQNAYKNWTFDDMDFVGNLSERGVDDPQKLPYYPYRDDGQLIWDCLGNYVKDYLNLYYLSDEDVIGDYELQNWCKQLSGHLDSTSGLVPGFPKSITTREQLAQIVQRIIWTAGPQHAAVNFPQVDFTTFIPNAVGATYLAPVQGDVNERVLLEMMAPQAQTQVQVQASYALAGFHYDQLLDYTLDSADGSTDIVEKYRQQLVTQVRQTIVARNQQRAEQEGLLAYPYFLPENIPNSTSV